MKLTLQDLLCVGHTAMWNIDRLNGRAFTGVSTDSRSVGSGVLFLAIGGESLAGHQFVEPAFRRGAACAVVDRRADIHAYRHRPFLVVHDPTKGDGRAGNHYPEKIKIHFLALA